MASQPLGGRVRSTPQPVELQRGTASHGAPEVRPGELSSRAVRRGLVGAQY